MQNPNIFFMNKYLLFAASLSLSTLHAEPLPTKQNSNSQPQPATAGVAAPQQIAMQRTAGTGTVTFHGNGGNGSMQPITGLSDGQELQLPRNTFTRTGYRFVGWTNMPNGNEPIY